MRCCRTRYRRGTTTVEFAFCLPVALFLILATIIGSVGIFRYQQTAELAREAARWASVHGGQYAAETGNPAATPEDIYVNAILPKAVALEPANLSYQVTWDTSNMPLDSSDNYATPHGNTVSVTVNYQWFPEVFLIGPFTLSSTSKAQMLY
jgi:Flp pilus assembly protein TadG